MDNQTYGPVTATLSDFPKVVMVRLSKDLFDERPYVPRQYCFIDVYMDPDEPSIGHCECSMCKKTVEPFIKFCPYCGAKSKGKRILKKKKTDSIVKTNDNKE